MKICEFLHNSHGHHTGPCVVQVDSKLALCKAPEPNIMIRMVRNPNTAGNPRESRSLGIGFILSCPSLRVTFHQALWWLLQCCLSKLESGAIGDFFLAKLDVV